MKSLLFALLCSLSISSISAMDKTPLQKIESELLRLNFAACGNRITIADIKDGNESRVSLEDAFLAKFRIINRIKRAQEILKWVTLKSPSDKEFNKVFACYKKENHKQVEIVAAERSKSATIVIDAKKEKPVSSERSVSAPAANENRNSALPSIQEEDEEDAIPQTSGALSILFDTKIFIL
jgi:hypothetical protein